MACTRASGLGVQVGDPAAGEAVDDGPASQHVLEVAHLVLLVEYEAFAASRILALFATLKQANYISEIVHKS